MLKDRRAERLQSLAAPHGEGEAMKTFDDRGKQITLERIDWHLRKLRSRRHVRLSEQ